MEGNAAEGTSELNVDGTPPSFFPLRLFQCELVISTRKGKGYHYESVSSVGWRIPTVLSPTSLYDLFTSSPPEDRSWFRRRSSHSQRSADDILIGRFW